MKIRKSSEKSEGIGIVRDRGQLTIPYSLRSSLDWIKTDTPVKMKLRKNKIIIEPIEEKMRGKKVNWNKLWKDLDDIQKSAKHKTNLTQFVIKDRETRR